MRARGLTLVELLIALAIFAVVSAASVMIFRGITRAWRTGDLRAERYQQARLLFDLFERELTSCVASLRFPVIGGAAELWFTGTLPGRAGIVERGYRLEGARLLCHDGAPADGDYATGESEACGRELSAFRVSYFDGSEWIGDWDGRTGAAQAGRVPKAVKIELELGATEADRFETIVAIPTG